VCECDVAIGKKIDRLARSKIIESKESAAAVPPAANHIQARPLVQAHFHSLTCGELLLLAAAYAVPLTC
jgi:hypothetical protein